MNFTRGIIISSLSFLIFTFGCNHAHEGACAEDKTSSHGSEESHNTGENCMNCHSINGSGEGCFKIAGSVYDSLNTKTQPDVTVRLYSGPNGTGVLKATVDGDRLGNFFTSDGVKFSGWLFPSVTGPSGKTEYMTTGITDGACNNCHGVTEKKIWVK